MSDAFEHTMTISLPADPARTFQALTNSDQLQRWFAVHAQVDPRSGGAYQFWGPATLGAPAAADPAQILSSFESGRSLAFDWPLHGVSTKVTYTVSPGDSAATSQLDIHHAVAGGLPYRRPKHVIEDLWRLHAGNLMTHLQGTTNVLLPDFTGGQPEVRASIEIAAPPARVFRALLEPELMNRWLGGQAKVDLGQRAYSYGWNYDIEGRSVAGGPTRIVEMVENQLLVTDWPDWRGQPDKPSTRVIWQLEPIAGGAHTRVTVIHAGFEHAVDRSDYQQGWGHFLDQLQKVALESRD